MKKNKSKFIVINRISLFVMIIFINYIQQYLKSYQLILVDEQLHEIIESVVIIQYHLVKRNAIC